MGCVMCCEINNNSEESQITRLKEFLGEQEWYIKALLKEKKPPLQKKALLAKYWLIQDIQLVLSNQM